MSVCLVYIVYKGDTSLAITGHNPSKIPFSITKNKNTLGNRHINNKENHDFPPDDKPANSQDSWMINDHVFPQYLGATSKSFNINKSNIPTVQHYINTIHNAEPIISKTLPSQAVNYNKIRHQKSSYVIHNIESNGAFHTANKGNGVRNDKNRNSPENRDVSSYNQTIPVPLHSKLLGNNIVGNDDSKIDSKKYLIYICHSLMWCGGWGDRQRGITAAYFLSRVVGREFKIFMNTPCKLSKFYQPNAINWLWESQLITNEIFVISDIFPKSEFRALISAGNFNSLFPQKFVYIRTNHDYFKLLLKNPFYSEYVSEQKNLFSKKNRFRSSWTDLMQPSEYLLQKLQKVVGTSHLVRKGMLPPGKRASTVAKGFSSDLASSSSSSLSRLICAHVRFGRNPTIPMDEPFDSITPDDIPKLLAFMKSKDKRGTSHIFLASDNDAVKTEFRKVFGNRFLDYGGKIMHIDRQRNERNACAGFESALLDQLILSVCDVLIVSRSGFSIHASLISNSTLPVYILEDGSISPLKM